MNIRDVDIKNALNVIPGAEPEYARGVVVGLVAGLMAASGEDWLPIWQRVLGCWKKEYGRCYPAPWDVYVILTNEEGTYFLDRTYHLVGRPDQPKLPPMTVPFCVEHEPRYSTLDRPNWADNQDLFTAYWMY